MAVNKVIRNYLQGMKGAKYVENVLSRATFGAPYINKGISGYLAADKLK